ncbi:pyridoxal kinase [Polycladidibacter hongkongensis]|uniref:pyridoxal kinase n=1 Tax=Polycladidibacter hongkongensis TaxID=1647556 RepID=UPI0008304932|nr:pyridoxal kinase [Pseudovibrio hongkongensis]
MSLERFSKKLSVPQQNEPKKKGSVLVITSQVVRGSVGGRVSVFALERFGYPVWFLPTILLPWHPGRGAGTRITAAPQSFAHIADEIANSGWLGEIDAVITGYMGSAEQTQELAHVVRAVKQVNPKALYLCDPVIGDRGGLYVPQDVATSIRENLLPLADVTTPNRFELAWLSGMATDSEQGAIAAARGLGVERTIVSSALAMRRNCIGNLFVGADGCFAIEHAEVNNPPHGTGDLLASLFVARLLEGASDESALKKATASTFELLARSVKMEAQELLYSEHQDVLLKPFALVNERRIIEAPVRA